VNDLPTSRRLPWGFLLCATLLTACGVTMVISATASESNPGLANEARAQVQWWLIACATGVAAWRVPFSWWKELAIPGYCAALLVILGMTALAGTALVPPIKGQCNWIVLGPVRVQPVEFVKLAALLATARLMTAPGFDARNFGHVILALVVAGLPALLLAKEDLGSALTFVPLAFGILLVAGLRLRHLALLASGTLLVASLGVMALPKEGPKSYQYKRIQAWLHPDDYALTEGYQTARSVSAIGSGQVLGKGWGQGDQNRLGMIPEKHTDLIFAVTGEEMGFAGGLAVLALFATFAWTGLANASSARDTAGRYVIVGYVSLVVGQAGINLAVATGLMPVTGVTLPFFSYGGSSLLGMWLGLGFAMSAAVERGP
jgi:rod shape determining protein RodA